MCDQLMCRQRTCATALLHTTLSTNILPKFCLATHYTALLHCLAYTALLHCLAYTALLHTTLPCLHCLATLPCLHTKLPCLHCLATHYAALLHTTLPCYTLHCPQLFSLSSALLHTTLSTNILPKFCLATHYTVQTVGILTGR